MIIVTCLGHIGTSVGHKEVSIEGSGLDASDIVEKLRKISSSPDPGFTKFNTLLMVEDGEAFVPAGTNRRVQEGERVVLIPFSHGG